MKRLRKTLSLLMFFVLLSVIFPSFTYAYVDPGTGSYVVQVVLAFVFGGLFGTKVFRKKIKNFIREKLSKNGKEVGNEDNKSAS